MEDVSRQLDRLPGDASHLVVSAGGNNALDYSGMILRDSARSFSQVLSELGDIGAAFRRDYAKMLSVLVAQEKPVVVCTIYDAIPGLSLAERTGLCVFNDVIFREAFRLVLPVIDLRLTCPLASDFSGISPIEPSVAGGRKIAQAIASAVKASAEVQTRPRVYV